MNPGVKSPKLALRIKQKLKETGSNPRRLSQELGQAYDHVRKISNGDVFPGPHTLKAICQHLHLDYAEMDRLVKQDRMADKGWLQAATGKDPDWNRIESFWNLLSKDDRAELLALAKLKAERYQNLNNKKTA